MSRHIDIRFNEFGLNQTIPRHEFRGDKHAVEPKEQDRDLVLKTFNRCTRVPFWIVTDAGRYMCSHEIQGGFDVPNGCFGFSL
jgi:hypothetical protein